MKSQKNDKNQNSEPKASGASSASSASSESPATGDRLTQVRELLFGHQVQEIDSRLAELERRMATDNEAVRSDTTRRIESLEAHMRSEFDSLVERIDREHSDRLAGVEDLTQDLQALAKTLEERARKIETHVDSGDRKLREQLRTTETEIFDEMKTRTQDIVDQLQTGLGSLRAAKLDRNALSEVLMEAAERITVGLDGTGAAND